MRKIKNLISIKTATSTELHQIHLFAIVRLEQPQVTMELFSIAFTLFLLMDSVGNIPIFISLLQEFPPKRQLSIIFREMIIALMFLILFYFVGDGLLSLLEVQDYSVRMAGGIILFLVAIKMIFQKTKEDGAVSADGEPFIVPLAVPLVAGPATLATIIIYTHEAINALILLAGILMAWGASLIILLTSPFIQKVLGKKGVSACEKLMGLILTLLAIEMFMGGVKIYLLSLA